jgi:hypothetical protein
MFGTRRLGLLAVTRGRDSALVLGQQVGSCHSRVALPKTAPLLLCRVLSDVMEFCFHGDVGLEIQQPTVDNAKINLTLIDTPEGQSNNLASSLSALHP